MYIYGEISHDYSNNLIVDFVDVLGLKDDCDDCNTIDSMFLINSEDGNFIVPEEYSDIINVEYQDGMQKVTIAGEYNLAKHALEELQLLVNDKDSIHIRGTFYRGKDGMMLLMLLDKETQSDHSWRPSFQIDYDLTLNKK